LLCNPGKYQSRALENGYQAGKKKSAIKPCVLGYVICAVKCKIWYFASS
jgi:hypothetical protein